MEVSALTLFARDAERTVAFYRALGVDLEPASAGRFVADLAGVRVMIAPGSVGEPASRAGSPGTAMPGFAVSSMRAVLAAVGENGGVVVRPAESTGWGIRAVVADPDGRTVEVIQYAVEGHGDPR